MSKLECKYSGLYEDADKSFVVNFESKNQRPIRISLPEPPRLDLIDGWGMHPDEQVFRRLEMPYKLKQLELNVRDKFKNQKTGVNGTNILDEYWDELEVHKERLKDEIAWLKKFIWHMWYGYWIYIDGKPTWIPPWYFSYLNIHRMTTENGYEYPEYRDRGRLRFLFRHYLYNTTETFADLDKDGVAYKVANEEGRMVYRTVDTGDKTFFGIILTKGRREGLTNEYSHIITRIMTSTRGADKLGTIVSMGGENAETHFRRKLMAAWAAWPLFTKPIWRGGFSQTKQLEFSSNTLTNINTLDCIINYTDSADDLINSGKMIIAAGYDEQGIGKRQGNVQTRWQINKEAMSLGAGSHIIGWCEHPSTVEKMEEGGIDFKIMCDASNFYQRKKNGQTRSGLGYFHLPSEYCLEEYVDAWGQPVLVMPSKRQIKNGFRKRIGSRIFIENTRKDLYEPDNPKKMDDYRSFVRKFPQDANDCWTGVAGQLGWDNERIRQRKIQLINNPKTVRGEFKWQNRSQLIVKFVEKADGRWIVAKQLSSGEANQISTMLDYSAFVDDEVVVNRPANPTKYMMGVDPQQFSNRAEAIYLEAKGTKKSDTGIAVLQRRDKKIDPLDEYPEKWKSRHFIASFRARLGSSLEAVDEILKVSVYYGCLIHIEQNRTEIWERIVEKLFSGYLNYNVEVLAGGQVKRAPKPGTALATQSKKKGFSHLADYFNYHSHEEPIYEFLEDADTINSMEELPAYDRIAAHMQALLGDDSIYADIMWGVEQEDEKMEVLGAPIYSY